MEDNNRRGNSGRENSDRNPSTTYKNDGDGGSEPKTGSRPVPSVIPANDYSKKSSDDSSNSRR